MSQKLPGSVGAVEGPARKSKAVRCPVALGNVLTFVIVCWVSGTGVSFDPHSSGEKFHLPFLLILWLLHSIPSWAVMSPEVLEGKPGLWQLLRS